jgi:hypothetical protein
VLLDDALQQRQFFQKIVLSNNKFHGLGRPRALPAAGNRFRSRTLSRSVELRKI